jgi:hypothetical protein
MLQALLVVGHRGPTQRTVGVKSGGSFPKDFAQRTQRTRRERKWRLGIAGESRANWGPIGP